MINEGNVVQDMSNLVEPETSALARVAAGQAGTGMLVLFAAGWMPPTWLTAGVAGILFYCMIMIAIAQLAEFIWQWPKSRLS